MSTLASLKTRAKCRLWFSCQTKERSKPINTRSTHSNQFKPVHRTRNHPMSPSPVAPGRHRRHGSPGAVLTLESPGWLHQSPSPNTSWADFRTLSDPFGPLLNSSYSSYSSEPFLEVYFLPFAHDLPTICHNLDICGESGIWMQWMQLLAQGCKRQGK